MKKVVKFLEDRNIYYNVTTFGGPCEFNYPVVDGLNVFFDCDFEDDRSKMRLFGKFMDSMHTCVAIKEERGEGHYQFTVMRKYDRRKLAVHKAKVAKQEQEFFEQLKRDIEAFNSGKLLIGNE